MAKKGEGKTEPSVGTLMWRNMKMRHTKPRLNKKMHTHPGKVVQRELSERAGRTGKGAAP